jgi:glycosyltransferase involved in cell wall biosynthesis
MKFLLLNQTFYPDVMATGQYLEQVALELAGRGHGVTVVASRRAYDHPEKRFPRRETWHGIRICRVASTGFGKAAKWRRATDFATFMLCCSARLALLPRHDVILALTSPPLISFLGAWLAKLHRCRFVYWVMDFNPDQAVAAGWLRPDSLSGKLLERMSRFSLRRAAKIIALDRFMRERIVAKGIRREKVAVIPPWPLDDEVHFDLEGRERFREAHGLGGKFVVMHAGNHSPCHPLDSVLEAARRLRHDPNIVFCFVGGGSEFRKLQLLAGAANLTGPGTLSRPLSQRMPQAVNLLCLPYQPLNQLSAALSAADLHVVVMGDAFVGIVHPCKIYNILSVGAPVLYIGPRPSHLSEILDSLQDHPPCAAVQHGDVAGVLDHIARVREAQSAKREARSARREARSARREAQSASLPVLIALLESP